MERLSPGLCADPNEKGHSIEWPFRIWLREPDLNRRPSGYEPDELPDCSIPRLWAAFYIFRLICHGFIANRTIFRHALSET
ncbi:hypothetical protein PSEUDO9AG_41340 [Pseudomonas sp. 9Ag]|nr:hypothetical protein PSEUDO9AG_41340 [Pseudomonas sp. 9Ag]